MTQRYPYDDAAAWTPPDDEVEVSAWCRECQAVRPMTLECATGVCVICDTAHYLAAYHVRRLPPLHSPGTTPQVPGHCHAQGMVLSELRLTSGD